MSNKLSDAIAIIMPVLGVIISIFADVDGTARWVLIGILLAFVVGYSIFTTLKANKNLSNTQVINKSKRYIKQLMRMVKANSKSLSKSFNLSELAEAKKNINNVVKKIKHSKIDNCDEKIAMLLEQKKLETDNYYNKSHKYTDPKENIGAKKTRLIAKKYAQYKDSQKVFNLIYGTIKDMERILLQLEQHELRVKLGKYVVKYSTDIDKTIHAYVDYLGWTYVLLDKNKKGFQAIQSGINLIDYKINVSKEGHEKYCELKKAGEQIPEVIQKQHIDYCEYTLQKARALRHLGTTYYTYRSFKDTFVKTAFTKEKLGQKSVWNFENTVNPYVKIKLAEGLALMEEESVINYFIETKQTETYSKMVSGIKYNDLLYDYYVALYNNEQSIKTYIHINDQLNALIEEIKLSGFKDNHRLIKILTLKNQLKHKIYNKQDDSGVTIEGSDKWDELLAEDLKTIESVLNKNIYFDEAMEVYVCQKIRKLYTDIDKVFEN